jgi:hypothetical protein
VTHRQFGIVAIWLLAALDRQVSAALIVLRAAKSEFTQRG